MLQNYAAKKQLPAVNSQYLTGQLDILSYPELSCSYLDKSFQAETGKVHMIVWSLDGVNMWELY